VQLAATSATAAATRVQQSVALSFSQWSFAAVTWQPMCSQVLCSGCGMSGGAGGNVGQPDPEQGNEQSISMPQMPGLPLRVALPMCRAILM
jgi:hypothetical protein